MNLAAILFLTISSQEPQVIDEDDFRRDYLKVVQAYEAAEKLSKSSPAAALEALEGDVLPHLPSVVEANLVVKYSKGLTKGDVKERHAFFPYRLAGECALKADQPAVALKYLEKSPSSAALLDKAKKSLAEKEKKPDPPAPPLQKPEFSAAPWLEQRDYIGALDALKKERERVKNYDAKLKEIRAAAAQQVRSATSALALALPRLNEPGFRKDHLEPCLESCARVPQDLETEELRWIRRLGAWLEKSEAAALEPLALEVAKFDPDYHVVLEQAQKTRLAEVQSLVEEARRSGRSERQAVLERLEAAERAFRKLSTARRYRDLDEPLEAALARRPIDNLKLDEARKGVASVREVRVLASQLDLLWTSSDRTKLADQDQKDLAVYLGVYRCYALFLDGKSIEEAAKDTRVVEVFRNGPALPKGLSPKIANVLELVKSGK